MWAVLPWVPEQQLASLTAALAAAAAMAAMSRPALFGRRPPALAVLGATAEVNGGVTRIDVLAAAIGEWRVDSGAEDPSGWSIVLPEGGHAIPESVEMLRENGRTLMLIRCSLSGWTPVPRIRGIPFVLRGPAGASAVGVARIRGDPREGSTDAREPRPSGRPAS